MDLHLHRVHFLVAITFTCQLVDEYVLAERSGENYMKKRAKFCCKFRDITVLLLGLAISCS